MRLLRVIQDWFKKLFGKKKTVAEKIAPALDATEVVKSVEETVKKIKMNKLRTRSSGGRRDPHQRKYKKPQKGKPHPLRRSHFGTFSPLKPW